MASADRNKFPRRFGPYVIVSFLGEGGMGNVYLALMGTQGAEKLCVLKQMGSTWSALSPGQIPDMDQRFRREAEIAMALSHPCIAKTFHAASDEEGPFLVQEFVDGTTLEALVHSANSAEEAIPVPVASHIVRQIAGALAYLHDFQGRGLVHRDVTPDNIMLSFQGEVKLIDFGVAKSTALDDSSTQRGCVGKADWIAPELFRGQKLDRRADLFSLGMVYWYLLSGKHPGSTLANPTGTNGRFAPPSAFNPEVPDQLNQVVAKAISPDPSLRFQKAKEFAEAVARFVPSDLRPEQQLAQFLARHTASRELKEKGLALRLAEARPLLGRSSPPAVPIVLPMNTPNVAPPAAPAAVSSKVEAPPTLRRRTSRWTVVAIFVATVGLVAGVGAVLWRHEPPGPTAPPSGSAQPPTLPPSPAARPTSRPFPETPPRTVPPVSQPTNATSEEAAPRPVATRPAPTVAKPPSSGTVTSTIPEPKPKAAPLKRRQQTSDTQTADELIELAGDSFERSDLSTAWDLAGKALLKGGGARAYILIGRIAARRKDFSAAQAAFESALRLSPGNPQATRLLDKIRQGNFDDAR